MLCRFANHDIRANNREKYRCQSPQERKGKRKKKRREGVGKGEREGRMRSRKREAAQRVEKSVRTPM